MSGGKEHLLTLILNVFSQKRNVALASQHYAIMGGEREVAAA